MSTFTEEFEGLSNIVTKFNQAQEAATATVAKIAPVAGVVDSLITDAESASAVAASHQSALTTQSALSELEALLKAAVKGWAAKL